MNFKKNFTIFLLLAIISFGVIAESDLSIFESFLNQNVEVKYCMGGDEFHNTVHGKLLQVTNDFILVESEEEIKLKKEKKIVKRKHIITIHSIGIIIMKENE